MAISSIAEEYYFIAGYIGWADIHDPGFRDRLKTLMFDPFLVGLRYDLSNFSPDVLLIPEVDANFSAIEQQGVPFDLMIGPHQLKHACHLAYKHPKLKLVLNHCGMPVEVMATQPSKSTEVSVCELGRFYVYRFLPPLSPLIFYLITFSITSHKEGFDR
ncbi:unnamed protein product [Dibothriocephalus latus]|uniref:Amidohydrolase-related domain-containing protein n=1 Tax=Dibothriocephalus latus TaxID=60516 RepID=A0A3P7SAA0_DIBLA|nr:unnamed protein product [Dibothriocephalus latus]